jgi:enoyl-CoA hydratase
MSDMEFVHYEADDGVGVITLDRPQAANAQNMKVLRELDQAWTLADEDPDVRVIVFKTNGKHFSAGHDMSEGDDADWRPPGDEFSSAVYYDQETRGYLHWAKKWRDVPKPSIACVQGKCIAAGLMLCWPCDIIIAAENAEFSDPVLYMGIAGVEYHGHTWEFGPRKAKEILFSGSSITAEEARQLGMVNQVVPLDELVPTALAMADRIKRNHPWALRMAKRAVNKTMDLQGFSNSIDAVFDLHHLGHMHALTVNKTDMPVLVDLEAMKAHQS